MKLFPICKNSKKPAIANWNSLATSDQEQHKRWANEFPQCNWGVACGPSNLIVVDIDADGQAYFDQLDIQYGFPETYTVKTPKGKHHYFYGRSRNRVRILPGIDIRSVGGYVLAPGSWVDNKPYSILTDLPIANAPTWLLDLIGKPKERDPQATEITSCDNLIDARRAATYLQTVQPAIEGQGGDLQTYKAACTVRDLGISRELCLSLFLDHYNPRCIPPWEEKDLEAKINHAYRYAQNETIGSKSVEAIFSEPVTGVFDEQDNSLYPISRIGLTFPKREWIVENWIPKGPTASTLFTGEGGTGKSLLALQLAIAVSTGTDWLGFETTQMPVLFLTCEDDKNELDRRVYMIRKENPFLGIDNAPVSILPRAGKESLLCVETNGVANRGKFYSAMETALEKFKPKEAPGLWIIDTVADVYAGNENIRSAVNGFLKTIIGGLALKYNVTPILIAHPPSQQGAGSSKKNYAGSTAWHNGVRNRLVLSWSDAITPGGQRVRSLSHEKANYSGSATPILLEWVNGCLTPVAEEVLESAVDAAIIDAISEASAKVPLSRMPQSPNYIGKIKLKTSKGSPIKKEIINDAVIRLMQKGIIEERKGNRGDKYRKNGLFVVGEHLEANEEAPF